MKNAHTKIPSDDKRSKRILLGGITSFQVCPCIVAC